MLSIIIPTFNEKENVRRIVSAVGAVMGGRDYEIIFVDDSDDQTVSILNQLAEQNQRIRVFHRPNERGLATAVVLGFSKAFGEIFCVMDADLQHPPEIIPRMLFQIQNGADLVIPSRFIKGGSDGGLMGNRKLISWGARCMAWLFLKKARISTDPLGGFFMLRKQIVDDIQLKPIGWKILLEIIVKAKFSRIVEIPYQFQVRDGGLSKMGWKEQLNYLRHILRLIRSSPSEMRFWRFSLVGLSGVLVNLFIYTGLIRLFHWEPLLASATAAVVAILSNFFLNHAFTWPDSDPGKLIKYLVLFYLFSGVGILINLTGLYFLTRFGRMDFVIAQILAISGATIWNYVANSRFNWKENKMEAAKEIVIPDEESLA